MMVTLSWLINNLHMIYYQDATSTLVDKILDLATKVGVHIIDTYPCVCLVIDNIRTISN